ncbi:hypothetical protein X559_1920 [Paenilisteria newyorkensis]|nr:hypothetical protein X559_1920 [Listeria newyorkensis]
MKEKESLISGPTMSKVMLQVVINGSGYIRSDILGVMRM